MTRSILAVFCGAALATNASAAPPLECTPARIDAATQELTLSFAGAHGRSLAVVNPAGAFLYLAGPAPAPDRLRGFADARRVTLDPRTLEGWRLAEPGRWERVFAATGSYEFRVANTLETDADDPADPVLACRVEFAGDASR